MATEFTVILENRPGTLARRGLVLGDAMVNIEAIHGNARETSAIVQFVSNDQDKAARALDAAGIAYESSRSDDDDAGSLHHDGFLSRLRNAYSSPR